MSHPHSGHLWNAAILAAAVAVALVAERISADARGTGTRGDPGADAFADIAGFMAPLHADSVWPGLDARLHVDPFEARGEEVSVAPIVGNPIVEPARAATRQLTAILIADDRPVAVVDDEVLGVGGRLRDGSKVAAIQPDRVWVVEKNGKWRMLTLSSGRQ